MTGVISERLREKFGPDLADWPVSERATAVATSTPDEAHQLGTRWPR